MFFTAFDFHLLRHTNTSSPKTPACRLFVVTDRSICNIYSKTNKPIRAVLMKSLRLKHRWSQEEVAQLSNLNVRTIQRVEKGEKVGSETLKALAAVFQISTQELVETIRCDTSGDCNNESNRETVDNRQEKALEKAKAIKYFYANAVFLLSTFVLFMLPNYNGGENAGALFGVFLSFSAIVIMHALFVFQPFGKNWEKRKVAELLEKDNVSSHSDPNEKT